MKKEKMKFSRVIAEFAAFTVLVVTVSVWIDNVVETAELEAKSTLARK
ncbi:hypothetical protein HZA26_02230 [Candidatus Nomurabacteria bacterium]|nr:hypothetical protein [Candidatus Nomurabacteria bacterium]